MAPAAPRNPLTGCRRRLMKHFTSPKRRYRTWTLTVNDLSELVDCEAFGNVCERCVRVGIVLMIACYAHHHQNPNFVRSIYSQKLLPWVILWTLFWLVTKEYDAAIGDISAADENAPLQHQPPKYRRFSDFLGGTDCQTATGFEVSELEKMLRCFDLPERCSVDRGRLDGKRYTFHREELLIYTLMHIKSGETHSKLSKDTGQKCDQRMAKGYKWLISYLDNRYDHLLGWNGMLVWRQYFPYFAEKIREYIGKCYTRRNALGHVQIVPGIYFNPGSYNVVGFVDCKVHEIGTPHSGPAAPEPDSPRRPWWFDFQRAFFDGHHHVHAVKLLTFMLPNGLYAALWGPASARRDDSQLVHWSAIDALLVQIQAVFFGCHYVFFGDSKFRVSRWRCIRGRHAPNRNGPWRNAREEAEDKVMNRARETIEHSYGTLVNQFHILQRREEIKLEQDPVNVLQMIRVCHLFYNLYVCANGNSVSSPNALNCRPPTIETYLNM